MSDGTLARAEVSISGSEIILVDATRLPSIHLAPLIIAHRESGAGMSVFCGPAQRDYCREQISSDASGAVQRAVRQYSDSSLPACGANPITIVLSRRMFRPDAATQLSNFAELTRHLQERLARAGDRVQCLRHPAVRSHASPLDALLWLVAETDSPPTQAVAPDATTLDSTVRVRGPVRFGKGVQIGAGALIIGPASLGDSAVIGADAVVSRSIILPGQSVSPRAHCHRLIGTDAQLLGELACENHLSQQAAVGVVSFAARGTAQERIKRFIDILASSLGLLLLAPLLLAVAAVIKLSSPGPVLFRHRRQGLDGVEFDCLKFRTMIRDADALQRQLRARNQVDGPQFKLANDPRVTRVGHLLRTTNLDELPQLINVLRGEMSLVGPRPSPDRENQCCPTWRKTRLSVKPGITGLWQVARSADRQLTDFQEWIYYDTRYVENRSLSLDLQIVWQTVRLLLRLGVSERWRARWTHHDTVPLPTVTAPEPGERNKRFAAST